MTDKTIGPHDLATSEGGRGYVAEYFSKRLRRHDFRRYIAEHLAADFACALAQHLHDNDPAQLEPVTYEDVVSTCECHGIPLPAECVELAVEIVNRAGPRANQAKLEFAVPGENRHELVYGPRAAIDALKKRLEFDYRMSMGHRP